MPPKNVSTKLNPVRLNSINQLRVKAPSINRVDPCTAIMSAMLTCWASPATGGCEALEAQLKDCMDTQKNKGPQRNAINYHLMRMYPKVVGPKKRKA